MNSLRPPPTEKQIAAIFRHLADDFADARTNATHERNWQRIQLKQSIQRKRQPRWSVSNWLSPARFVGVLAGVVAVVLAVGLSWPLGGDETSSPAILAYERTGGALADGWLTTRDAPAKLTFTDGSRVDVSERTLLKIDPLGSHSALARLGHGNVRVEVEHHEDTSWTFLAGPYEVRVEGTSFDLSYNDEALRLAMHEGRVRVLGPERQQWILERGDSLVLPPPAPPPATSPATAGLAPSNAAVSKADLAAATEEEAPKSSAAVTHRPAWTELLAQGRFEDIVQSANRSGIERALVSRSVAELAALGQAARYTGNVALAEECWRKVRSRAPRSSNAHQGAFFLGRIKEQQGRPGEARRWFERYLSESPGGVYASQALGRQVVLASGQGRTTASTELAREYLRRYPKGPYAGAARALVDTPSKDEPGARGRREAHSAE